MNAARKTQAPETPETPKVPEREVPEREVPETKKHETKKHHAAPGYVIEKDLPIPRTRGVSAHPYPFDKMEKGDSLFVERPDKTVNISNIKAAAEKRVPGSKWTTRKVDGGFRIWRVQ